MHSSKVKEISLIGILAAVNIASRIYLQALPNIKPVTSIIIISVMLFGLGFGVKLSIVTTVVSNLFLGMGTWTFFQILAWVVICLITQVLLDFLKKIHKEPKLFPMAIFSFFMGYVFGIVVSLEQLMLGGPSLYIVYYMAGLLFDTFHAVGNFCFYLICAPILMKVLKKGGISHEGIVYRRNGFDFYRSFQIGFAARLGADAAQSRQACQRSARGRGDHHGGHKRRRGRQKGGRGTAL